MQLASIRKKIDMYFPEYEDTIEDCELLKTIRFPTNFMYLTSQLPKPSYDETVDEDFDEKIKCTTLPYKPKNKRSDNFGKQRLLSRSKISTGGRKSQESDRKQSSNSISKPSRDLTQAKRIMKNNLAKIDCGVAKVNYRDIIKNKYGKDQKKSNSVSYAISLFLERSSSKERYVNEH
jgi:hypothetical protein